MARRDISLNPEVVERCLTNGRKLKETVNEMKTVTVIQWELSDWGEPENVSGHQLFNHKAKINPQTDIDDEGYVTQAWFEMSWIQDFQETDREKWALMKPSYFTLSDPLVYFRTYIDGTEAKLLPHPDF